MNQQLFDEAAKFSEEDADIIYNNAALASLERTQLQQLCLRYGLSYYGKAADMYYRLQEHAKVLSAWKHNQEQLQIIRSQSGPRVQQGRHMNFGGYPGQELEQGYSAQGYNQDDTSAFVGGQEQGSSSNKYSYHHAPESSGFQERDPSPVRSYFAGSFGGLRSVASGLFGRREEPAPVYPSSFAYENRDDWSSSWEVLDDRRASFETLPDLNDEAEALSRSVPGSYNERFGDILMEDMFAEQRETEREHAERMARENREVAERVAAERAEKYGTMKSWKSAENGGAGRRLTCDGEMVNMLDFGSQKGRTGVTGGRGHRSLAQKSVESLKALTASISLPANLRRRRHVPLMLQEAAEIVPPPGSKPGWTHPLTSYFNGSNDLTRSRSMNQIGQDRYRTRSGPFVTLSPGKTKLVPFHPYGASLYRENSPGPAPKAGEMRLLRFEKTRPLPVVRSPQKHGRRVSFERESTIRIVGAFPEEKPRKRTESAMGEWVPEPAWLASPTVRNIKQERSPSPPAASMLPPLRQSTLADDITEFESYLRDEAELEEESEEEQEELLSSPSPARRPYGPRQDSRDLRGVARTASKTVSPTSRGFSVPGSYPRESNLSTRGSTETGTDFDARSATPAESNDQLDQEGLKLLREINARLAAEGKPPIGQSLVDGAIVPVLSKDEMERRGLAMIDKINARRAIEGLPLLGQKPVIEPLNWRRNASQARLDKHDGRGAYAQGWLNVARDKEYSGMPEPRPHYPGRPRTNGLGLPEENVRTTQSVKRKASAEFTPSAPNGLPLRNSRSAAMLRRETQLESIADEEDSPRIKRMRVDRSASAMERNGGRRARIPSGSGLISGSAVVRTISQKTRGTVSTVKRRMSRGPDTLVKVVKEEEPEEASDMHMLSDPASVDSGVDYRSDSTSHDHLQNPRYKDKSLSSDHGASTSANHRNYSTPCDALRSAGGRAGRIEPINFNVLAPKHRSTPQGPRHSIPTMGDDLFTPQYKDDTPAVYRNHSTPCDELRPVQRDSEDRASSSMAPLQQNSAIQETQSNDPTLRDDSRPLENRTYAKSSRPAPPVPHPLTELAEQDRLARLTRSSSNKSAAAAFALKRSINPSSVSRIDVENHMPAHRRPAVKYPGYSTAEVDRAIRRQRGLPDPTDGGSAARRQLEQMLAKRA